VLLMHAGADPAVSLPMRKKPSATKSNASRLLLQLSGQFEMKSARRSASDCDAGAIPSSTSFCFLNIVFYRSGTRVARPCRSRLPRALLAWLLGTTSRLPCGSASLRSWHRRANDCRYGDLPRRSSCTKEKEQGTLTIPILREAVMEGALLRLRPKLMTVSTVVAGLYLSSGAAALLRSHTSARDSVSEECSVRSPTVLIVTPTFSYGCVERRASARPAIRCSNCFDGNDFMIQNSLKEIGPMKKLLAISMMLFLTLALPVVAQRKEYGEPEGGRDVCRRRCRHRCFLNSTGELSRAERIRRPVPGPEGATHQLGGRAAWFEHVHAEYAPMSADSEINRPARLGRIA